MVCVSVSFVVYWFISFKHFTELNTFNFLIVVQLATFHPHLLKVIITKSDQSPLESDTIAYNKAMQC